MQNSVVTISLISQNQSPRQIKYVAKLSDFESNPKPKIFPNQPHTTNNSTESTINYWENKLLMLSGHWVKTSLCHLTSSYSHECLTQNKQNAFLFLPSSFTRWPILRGQNTNFSIITIATTTLLKMMVCDGGSGYSAAILLFRVVTPIG